jgi:hypothetical protein
MCYNVVRHLPSLLRIKPVLLGTRILSRASQKFGRTTQLERHLIGLCKTKIRLTLIFLRAEFYENIKQPNHLPCKCPLRSIH